MGKLSISLVLFFSMLVLHANGNLMQPEDIDDTLQTESGSPVEVKKWYENLQYQKKLVTNTFNVFFHANGTGDNPNQVVVAQNYLPRLVPSWFGMVQTLDYPLTATYDINSEFLGYAQGFYFVSSKEEFSASTTMNLRLTKFSNSTLFLIGQDNFNEKYREFSIVGGTGIFRLATGTAISYAHSHEPGLAIVELTVLVRHYVASKVTATA